MKTLCAISENRINREQVEKSNTKIRSQINIPTWLNFITFIPNFGFLFGLFLIIIGVANRKKKLIIWGIFGILFTPFFWLVFLIVMEISGSNTEASKALTKHTLNELVKDLEYYKVKNKKFPDNLEELKKQNQFFDDTDNSNLSFLPWNNSKVEKVYYKRINDSTYILKAKGTDKLLDTNDDVFPDLK